MQYYDIHTHAEQTAVAENVVACYNVVVKEKTISDLPFGQPLSCGIHPWYIQADKIEDQLARFRDLACKRQVIMIGEAGLDKQVSAPFDLQVKLFEEQILISEELKKPLIIHCVKAWDELIVIRKKHNPSIPWIIHGFRKKGDLAEQLLKQGFYLSFGEHFQESALRKAWPDHLLMETDESSYPIQAIYQRIAFTLQVSVEELSRQVEQTIRRLFLVK